MKTKKRRKKLSRRMSLQRRRKMIFLLVAAVCCFVFVFAGSYFALKKYVTKVDEKDICDNVFIGTANVSGLNAKEAKKTLKGHLEEDKVLVLTMKVGKREAQATLGEMGLHIKDIDKTIKKALDYGKTGSMWKRYRQMKRLEKEPLVIPEEFKLDKDKARAMIEERAVPLENRAVNATITKSDTGFAVTEEKEGKIIDIGKSIRKIADDIQEKWEHEGFAVKMSLKTDVPKVTKEMLSGIKDELGSFSTDAGGGERWKNLKTGVDKLNGVVLLPGETISVYETTSPYDEEHGYVQAGAYENGQVVDAYGGGICQVSTTLYNAVILAELDIVERSPHSMTVGYVDPSRDAAIAGDYLDLKFKNRYDVPVFIFAEIDASNQLRFIIYGKEGRPENRTIAFESETLSTTEYGTTYVENPEASLGSMEYTGNPHTGKEARLWKIVYEDNAEVSREVFNNSYYEKSDEIVEVGTASSSSEATAIVSGAIHSQNYDTIQSAINKAYGVSEGGAAQEEQGGEDSAGGEQDSEQNSEQ